VSEDLEAQVMAAREAIIAGELQIFAGPLADRDGTERIAADAVLSDGDLWAMDWYVAGVTGGE
jgi:hypothetical protein